MQLSFMIGFELMSLLLIVGIFFAIYVFSSMVVECDAFWFLRKPVYLLHFNGVVTKSRIYNLGKTKVAYAYPSVQVDSVTLLDGGTTSGLSYIVAWSDTGEFSEEQRERTLL